MIHEYGVRGMRLVFGLFLYALGIYLTIQAHIGLAPWEAFSMGITYHVDLSYGTVVILTGVIILAIDCALGEKLGMGTVINTVLIGAFVDLIAYAGVIPEMDNPAGGVAMLIAGHVSICVGTYYYVGAGLGCGPRDALMVALGKRLPRFSIGFIRGAIEGTVLLVGWLLGAPVGLGTVISVFGIGFILQCTFAVLKFDVKSVEHESLACTVRRLRGWCA